MLVSQQESEKRDLQIVKDPEKIAYLLRKHLVGLTMLLNGYEPPPEVMVIEARGDNHVVLDFGTFAPEVGEVCTLHKIMSRYIHISGKIIEENISGGRYHLLLIDHLAVATQQRNHTRIPVVDDEVFISNIRISRNEINVNMTSVPISIRLGLDELKVRLQGKADHIDIQVYESETSAVDSITNQVCRSGKPLLVRDTSDVQSYKPYNKFYFNYADYLKSGIQKKISEARQKNITSEMCIPIIYLTHDQTTISLGYVYMSNKLSHFSPDDVKTTWHIIREVISRIRDSNTMLVHKRETVLDISLGGLMLSVKNPQLIEGLRSQKSFTFDLFFHMQAPITLYGIIRSFVEGKGEAKVGVQIEGNSARLKGMERFRQNVRTMEASSNQAAAATASALQKKFMPK